VTSADGYAEVEAAITMLGELPQGPRITVGADKGYDTPRFIAACRLMGITPHVAQKQAYTAIDGRTTRRATYALSQRRRKRIEEAFGWMKTVGPLRKLRHRGGPRVDWIFTFTAAAYNMVRLRTLLVEPA